ncbi:MAG: BatA domain-containing protein [Planctomycetota bacterium]
MFLFPALTIGFALLAAPPLVHLINMLRHRRQRWAAMDFLLASYRRQRKWIRLRQFLLLLARIAVCGVLVAMLCGWTGTPKTLAILGGSVTHHVIVLDDSYSMGQLIPSDGRVSGAAVIDLGTLPSATSSLPTAYDEALAWLDAYSQTLLARDGEHRMTVIRGSRAHLIRRSESDDADRAADLVGVTLTGDPSEMRGVLATETSPLVFDLQPAVEMAGQIIASTEVDQTNLMVISDLTETDWSLGARTLDAISGVPTDVSIRLVDVGAEGDAPTPPNLAITSLTPKPDVWVAGVPVTMEITVANHSDKNTPPVPVEIELLVYDQEVETLDVQQAVSAPIEDLPSVVFPSIAAGAAVTQSFQVFQSEPGTHVVRAKLPDDRLRVDNVRSCLLPLSEPQKVLIVDGDDEARGAYFIESVLRPGSQVDLGAIPQRMTPAEFRSIEFDSLRRFRAVYLLDVPEISESSSDALRRYVEAGGGLVLFLGQNVDASIYNERFASLGMADSTGALLLPAALNATVELQPSEDAGVPDVVLGESSAELLGPLASLGNAAVSLVAVSKSWALKSGNDFLGSDNGFELEDSDTDSANAKRQQRSFEKVLLRRDELPWVTLHQYGDGNVVTVLSGIEGNWTNWSGDPSFVVFLLESNAKAFSGSSPPVSRQVEERITLSAPDAVPTAEVQFSPPAITPPREAVAVAPLPSSPDGSPSDSNGSVGAQLDPVEVLVSGEVAVEPLLRPGVAEWSWITIDGATRVRPSVTVIETKDSRLEKADFGEIRQALLPREIEIVASSQLRVEAGGGGQSRFTLLLLGILAGLLAIEQILAYWASYHQGGSAAGTSSGVPSPSISGGVAS